VCSEYLSVQPMDVLYVNAIARVLSVTSSPSKQRGKCRLGQPCLPSHPKAFVSQDERELEERYRYMYFPFH
jgi:hypothetical protein